jgi:sugar O-acyltransferase (sialic acid O-acetyltransferase NeuD family)
MTAPILLVGAGGHATACIDVIESHGGYTIAGLIGAAAEIDKRILGYPVIGTDDDLPELLGRCASALVAVGHIKTPAPRIRLFTRLQALGFSLPALVSPLARVSRRAALGAGTIVMHGAIVNAGASVGCNCIINSQALVEHDAAIGDHCHIATAAIINGGVRVGMGTFIGSNATLRQGISVGERCTIGMGERVLEDFAPGAYGPAHKGHT